MSCNDGVVVVMCVRVCVCVRTRTCVCVCVCACVHRAVHLMYNMQGFLMLLQKLMSSPDKNPDKNQDLCNVQGSLVLL